MLRCVKKGKSYRIGAEAELAMPGTRASTIQKQKGKEKRRNVEEVVEAVSSGNI